MGISGSQTKDWLMSREKLINQVEAKNIIMHIGTNDINDNAVKKSADEYYYDVTRLINYISEENPSSKIYYFGIENRVGPSYLSANKMSEVVTNRIRDEYALTNENFTYIDSPSVYNADQGKYVCDDGIHPSYEGYKYYVEMLNELVEF